MARDQQVHTLTDSDGLGSLAQVLETVNAQMEEGWVIEDHNNLDHGVRIYLADGRDSPVRQHLILVVADDIIGKAAASSINELMNESWNFEAGYNLATCRVVCMNFEGDDEGRCEGLNAVIVRKGNGADEMELNKLLEDEWEEASKWPVGRTSTGTLYLMGHE